MLTNDVFSFGQPGPDLDLWGHSCYGKTLRYSRVNRTYGTFLFNQKAYDEGHMKR